MAEQDLLPQILSDFSPENIQNMEDLYGLRAEELFRGINPNLANRIYGPRSRMSPQDAAELKVDLAKTYKDLAKVSQDGANASASDRVKLAIAAMQAGAKTEAASIAARGAITRMEMSGEYNMALQNLKDADSALSGLGPISSSDRASVATALAPFSGNAQLQQLDRQDLFNRRAASSQAGGNAGLMAAQDAVYNEFRTLIAGDTDPQRTRRLIAQIAINNQADPAQVKSFFEEMANVSGRENQMIATAFDGVTDDPAMKAAASYQRAAQSVSEAHSAARNRPGGSGAQAFLNVGLAAIEPGPGGVQVDNQTLQSLGVTAEQLQDPAAMNDIQTAAQAQIENLFTAIDEGAAATPYIQEKVDQIKQSARIEGSDFREFLKESGLNPDSPAAVDVGFELLEDEYAEVRKYETRQAKMQASAARRLRRQQRMSERQQRMSERQRGAEGELAAGTVQAGPDPMMPIDQELEMMEQQADQRQGQAAPAAEAPAAPDPEEADLVQRGLILGGTPLIPLGKLEGDNTYEYAFDTSTQEFIGYKPGQDPSTGNRFDPQAIGLEQSNPRLYNSMNSTLASKAAQIQEPASQEAPTQEAQGADPTVQREGVGVRRSQTENMQTIEKRLRAAARAARKRGNEESANNLEEEADRYLTLESGVVYREEEEQAQGVGTGFEQEEMLPGDEDRTLEDVIPEDQPSQVEQTRLRPQPLEPIENLLRTEEEKTETAPQPEFEGQPGTEPTLSQFERSRSLMGLPAGFTPQTNKPTSVGNTASLQEAAAKRLEEMRKREEQSQAGATP